MLGFAEVFDLKKDKGEYYSNVQTYLLWRAKGVKEDVKKAVECLVSNGVGFKKICGILDIHWDVKSKRHQEITE